MKLTNFIQKRGEVLFFKELVMSFILLFMPFTFFLLYAIPEKTIIEVGWLNINSEKFGFDDLNIMYWFVLMKGIPVVVLIFWYFTCKLWWRLMILVPLIFSLAQFFHMLTTDRFIDDNEFWIAFILSLPIILLFMWIDKKIYSYRSNLIMMENINIEVDELIEQNNLNHPNQNLNEFVSRFDKIKRRKLFMNEEKYLLEIMELKNELIISNKLSQHL